MKTITKTIEIKLKSKLHIGKGNESILSGGGYTETCKNAYDEAYIPASSIKGKLRFLLSNSEKYQNEKYQENVCKLFGLGANFTKSEESNNNITRLLFRDGNLNKKNLVNVIDIKCENSLYSYNKINPEKLNKPFLRNVEFISEGTIFEASIIIRLIEGDNEKDFIEILQDGFNLLNNDYLGANGSRGYGAVEIKFKEEPKK